MLKKIPIATYIYYLIFTGYALRMSVTPYMDRMRLDLSLNYSQTGLLFSAFMLGYIAFRLPAGIWADRFGSRRILMAGSALAGIAQLAMLAFPAYIPLLAFRVLVGVGAGVIYTASVRVLAIAYQRTRRGFSMGILQSAVGAGSLFALIFPALFPSPLRWQTALSIYPLLSFIGVGVAWLLPDQSTASENGVNHNLQGKSGDLSLVSAIAFFQLFSLTAGLAWLPTYFANRYSVSVSVSGILSSFSSIVLVLVALATGYVLDYWRVSSRMMSLGCILTALGYSGLLLDKGFGPAVFSLIFLGLGLALFLPALTLAAVELLGPLQAGVSSGITGTAAQIGATLAGVVVGWLVDQTGNLSSAWLTCIFSSLLAFVLLWIRGLYARSKPGMQLAK